MFLPACGEKWHSIRPVWLPVGSPPRVRGKDATIAFLRKQTRITPACAGKSTRPQESTRSPKDHPRVCGEKSAVYLLIALYLGSPPRVRGKVGRVLTHSVILRITPACAGKSETPAPTNPRYTDHPRVCGEKMPFKAAKYHDYGSPPRVRGKGSAAIRGRKNRRITPACAGKRAQKTSQTAQG